MKKIFILMFLTFSLLCSCDTANGKVDGVKYDRADEYQIGDFSYQASQIECLELDWVIGEVELVLSSAETLKVYESGKELSDSKKLHYLLDKNTLRIQFWESEYNDKILKKDKFITIEIPSNIDLDITTISADLKAEELACNNLEFFTVSGDVHISKFTATKLEMNSVSGDASIGNMQVNSVLIETTSGDCDLKLTKCDSLLMNTVSGDTFISLDHLGATVTFSTVSGDYHGDGNVIGDGACKVTIESVSGDLRVQ